MRRGGRRRLTISHKRHSWLSDDDQMQGQTGRENTHSHISVVREKEMKDEERPKDVLVRVKDGDETTKRKITISLILRGDR